MTCSVTYTCHRLPIWNYFTKSLETWMFNQFQIFHLCINSSLLLKWILHTQKNKSFKAFNYKVIKVPENLFEEKAEMVKVYGWMESGHKICFTKSFLHSKILIMFVLYFDRKANVPNGVCNGSVFSIKCGQSLEVLSNWSRSWLCHAHNLTYCCHLL